jgi:hypothetical protein
MTAVLLILALAYGHADAQPLATGRWEPQTYAPAPVANPLRGFLPYRGGHPAFPHSMEWEMVPWRALQAGPADFTWAPLELILDDVASRGHQAVFRIYADAPNRPSALPAFLADVAHRTYTDFDNGRDATSVSPDYDDPRLVDAMRRTIAALGARYDGDPRIGFITVGFIGFWGEWHTFRPGCQCDEWMPSPRTQRAVLDAFDDAFDRTRILVRNPDVGWKKHRMGFHDDSFAGATIDPPEWTFVGRLKKAGATKQWRREPIGGELMPERQACAFSEPSCLAAGQGYDASVAVTHATWLLNHEVFSLPGGPDKTRALAAARRLGYELFVSAVKLRDVSTDDALKVEIRLENRGVAPFYYRWPVWIGVADASGAIVASFRTDWDLTRAVDPRKPVTLKRTVRGHGLPAGSYTLLLRAQNPLANGPPLAFANAGWQKDVVGWVSLGAFRVRPR